MTAELLVVGCSHRTAPLELRESLAFAPDQVLEALALARHEKVLAETMILSTCHRTEFYSLTVDASRAERYVRDMISRLKGSDLLGSGPYAYAYRDRETARHLLRVATGLDSVVLGEVQILGQVREAYSLACQGGSAGVFLGRLLDTALRAGKRARAETDIGSGAVSFTAAAVSLTKKIFSDFSDKNVLVVGSGEFGRLAAQHFAAERPASLVIANRTRARAESLCEELESPAQAADLRDLDALVRRADIVVTAVTVDQPILDEEMVRRALRDRGGRPLVFADFGVPRNVAPSVAKLDNVFLYSLESLRTIVDQNLARRRREIPRVETIVEEEIEKFYQWMRGLQVTPVVKELRDRFEAIRAREVESRLRSLSPADRQTVDALTRSLVNKLLHRPTTQIRAIDLAAPDGLSRIGAVRELFGLDGADAEMPETGDSATESSARRGPDAAGEKP